MLHLELNVLNCLSVVLTDYLCIAAHITEDKKTEDFKFYQSCLFSELNAGACSIQFYKHLESCYP